MSRLLVFFRTLSPQAWRQLIVAFGVFLVPMFAFVQLANEVRERETLTFDVAVLRAVNSISTPQLDMVAIGATQLGGMLGVLTITLGLIMLLWKRQMRRRAAILAVGVGGAAALNLLLKAVFQRDRPQLWEKLVTENSYSFPSGHAMVSSALAISLIVIFWSTKYRWPVVAGSVVYMIGIGLTRLYLGVHYPTDVLAGWIVSGAWVALVVSAVTYRSQLIAALFGVRR